jgi:YfiH family protein
VESLDASLTSRSALSVLRPWSAISGVTHGFLGRTGGVSEGLFATLNLSGMVGDSAEAVEENWRRARQFIGAATQVAMVRQVHGNTVHVVTRESAKARPAGDGMVTAQRGVVLGVLSADCVPILMIDAKAQVAGAFHAGWRGVLAGIARTGLSAMLSVGASLSRIRVALGPSIGPCCFEVDVELANRFACEVEGAAAHRREGRPGKAYLDLRAIITEQLLRAGLRPDAITHAGPCTRCAAREYFSRRAAGGAVTGLQLSFVGFEP